MLAPSPTTGALPKETNPLLHKGKGRTRQVTRGLEVQLHQRSVQAWGTILLAAWAHFTCYMGIFTCYLGTLYLLLGPLWVVKHVRRKDLWVFEGQLRSSRFKHGRLCSGAIGRTNGLRADLSEAGLAFAPISPLFSPELLVSRIVFPGKEAFLHCS